MLVIVPVVSVCVGVVVSVFGFFGVGLERAGDELLEPVGGVEGWGTTVVVATAAPAAGLPEVDVSRVLVNGGVWVVVLDDLDAGFVGIVVFAAVAVVPVVVPTNGGVLVDITPPVVAVETTAVSAAPALLVVTLVLDVSVVALVDDSLLLHAAMNETAASAMTSFRIPHLRPVEQHNSCRFGYAPLVPKGITMAALLLAASLATAAPRVESVAESEMAIGKTLTLRVSGLSSLACDSLTLFVDGSVIRGLQPACANGDVRFALARNSENAEAWRALFQRPRGFTRDVSISVGSHGRRPLPTRVIHLPLRLISVWRLALTALVSLVAIAAMAFIRLRTGLLKNLPRLQIAFFFIVIVASTGWIWATTGELATLNATALALLGIGAGTAIGNAAIGKDTNVSAVDAGKRIADVVKGGGVAPPIETQVTFALPSLQAAACTVVFGVVFAGSVYRHAEMPQFGTQELLMLGISAGTYLALAFKPAPHA